jgi:hypothetical protein
MSLLKIPLIPSSTTALQVAFTPPNLSSSNDVIHDTPNEQNLLGLITYGLPFAKVHIYSLLVTVLIDEVYPRDYVGAFLLWGSQSWPCEGFGNSLQLPALSGLVMQNS